MRFLIETVRDDPIMVGGDYNMDAGYPRPVEFVDRIPRLTPEERSRILGDNAARFVKV
jgi:hypothetical protein